MKIGENRGKSGKNPVFGAPDRGVHPNDHGPVTASSFFYHFLRRFYKGYSHENAEKVVWGRVFVKTGGGAPFSECSEIWVSGGLPDPPKPPKPEVRQGPGQGPGPVPGPPVLGVFGVFWELRNRRFHDIP